MSSTRVFASPLFVGFDQLEQMLERASKSPTDGYPPYNIEQMSSTTLRITLAVAGFTMDDLQITQEDNQLVIRGRQTDDSQGRIFLHRGIAARQFQRAFVMAEGDRGEGRLARQRFAQHRTLPVRSRKPGSKPSRSASPGGSRVVDAEQRVRQVRRGPYGALILWPETCLYKQTFAPGPPFGGRCGGAHDD